MPLVVLLPILQAGLSALAEGLRFLSTEQGQKVVADMLADKQAAKKNMQDFASRVDQWVSMIGGQDKKGDG